MVEVKVVGTLPVRAHDTDAGADLFASELVVIAPGTVEKIPTNTRVALPDNTVGVVADKSSIGLKGLTVVGGIIDSSYRGEISVCLANVSKEHIIIEDGQKVAQLIVYPILLPKFVQVDSLDETKRGEGGFGSTGK